MASVFDAYGKLLLDDRSFGPAVTQAAGKAGDDASRVLNQKLGSGLRSGLARSFSVVQGGFGAVTRGVQGLGGALGHAKGQLVGLLSGPLGLLGLGGGLLSIAGAFREGIGKAQEFGGFVKRLTQLTGLGTQSTSALAGAFDHFGISADAVETIIGRVEKNLDALTHTQTKGKASSDELTKARERLAEAQSRLNDLEGKGGASSQTLTNLRNRLIIAETRLAEVRGKAHVSTSSLLSAENGVILARQRLSAAERGGTASSTALLTARNRVADAQRTLNGLLAQGSVRTNQAAEFQRKYGLSIVDASGKAKDFNTLLLDTADFWNNKTIPVQTRIAALNALYGKSWRDLLPLLSAGRAGVKAAEEEAARLGLTLNDKDLTALTALKEATRTWKDALGGLKLQIGLAVLPVLTDLTRGLTVLAIDNRPRIVGFITSLATGAEHLAHVFGATLWPAVQSIISIFRSAAGAAGGFSFVGILSESSNFARDLASVLNTFVAPAIKGIVGAWNGLPDDLRQLLIKGFLVNKVLRWTFGFDAVGFGVQLAQSFVANVAGRITASLAGDALEKVIGNKLVPQHVWVDNPGFGVPGAGPAEEAGAAGGLAATVRNGLRWVPGIGLVLVAGEAVNQTPGVKGGVDIFNRNVRNAQVEQSGVLGQSIRAAVLRILGVGEASRQFDAGRNQDFNDQSKAMVRAFEESQRNLAGLSKIAPSIDALHALIAADLAKLIAATKANDIHKFAAKLTADITRKRTGLPTVASTELRIKDFKAAISTLSDKQKTAAGLGDSKLAAELGRDIERIVPKLRDREFVLKQLTLAERIAHSSKGVEQKVADLTVVQRRLENHGNVNAAATIARLIGIERAVNRVTATVASNGGFVGGIITPGGRKFAGGGERPANVPSIVGERGPELSIPRVPAYILPAGITAALRTVVSRSASGGDTYHVNMTNPRRPETMADAMRELRRFGEMGLLPKRRPAW